MVFAPFTGIHNHNKSVTFGCGLLMKEDVDSYIWILQQFKQAMSFEPTIIVTDQDPAIRVAFDKVFETTRHRWCMWHIMDKVSKKVSATKLNNPGYRKMLGKIVWNDRLKPSLFEQGWSEFIDTYSEHDNSWFKEMYNQRTFWIPAYFRDLLLGGLIKTTSISESQNSFFRKYSNKNFTLVELYSHFESAMEKQRIVQLKNDVDSDTRSLELKTPMEIEKDCSDVYTLTVFPQVQQQVTDSCYYCCIVAQEQGMSVIKLEYISLKF